MDDWKCYFCGLADGYLWKVRIFTDDHKLVTGWICPCCDVKHHDKVLRYY